MTIKTSIYLSIESSSSGATRESYMTLFLVQQSTHGSYDLGEREVNKESAAISKVFNGNISKRLNEPAGHIPLASDM